MVREKEIEKKYSQKFHALFMGSRFDTENHNYNYFPFPFLGDISIDLSRPWTVELGLFLFEIFFSRLFVLC